MRDVRWVLAAIAAVLLVLGGVLSLSAASVNQHPRVLSGYAAFPDYSAGVVGSDRANEVAISLTLTTRDPWIQGQPQELVATVDAQPGPGVDAVDLTTLIVYLERPAAVHPTILNSDLVLLDRVESTNRWISRDGPIRIDPNADVTGNDFFLGFSLSLNVDYANGRSYGYGGWHPDLRVVSPDILPNLAPYGVTFLAGGAACGILSAAAWTSRRNEMRIA